ncbi:MAG: type I-E CRISPR-associated protein Cas5/CasD [Chloroflexi bacterium]|nr:MAG: type I-E CRISPR-associated protein Cas5/CasD [Chloroflexota bacterium]
MTNTLFLRLEGAMQSWGERGRWSIRDTAPEPTKSGIIGLAACALGIGTDAPIKALSEAVEMGVRVDKPGVRLTDYHTIGGGSNKPMLLTAQGKPKKSSGKPHTEISYRDYLCDASFLVALRGEVSVIAQMAAAVQNPVWPIYLGRKSCPPSRPIFDGVGEYDNLQMALQAHKWPPDAVQLTAVLECDPTTSSAVRRRDHLVARSHRVYHPRYTQTILLEAG